MRGVAFAVVLFTALTSAAVFLPPGQVIYVDQNAGPIQTGSHLLPFADIQQAIDAAAPGATIRIAVGYYTPFTVSKRLHLQGASIDNVRVVSDNGSPSAVTADGAVIEGITFLGPGEDGAPAGEGLRIEQSQSVLVLSCKFPFFATGVDVQDSDVTLSASILEYGVTGALVRGDAVLHASANLIVNNETGVDCAGGEMESCDDLIDGDKVDISDSCAPPGY